MSKPAVRWSANSDPWSAIPNEVLRDPGLSPGARVLYGLLVSYAWQSEDCFPGQERLAEELGVSDRTVRSYTDELADADLLEVERRGAMKSNRYVLHPPSDRKDASNHDRNSASGHEENQASGHERKLASGEEDAPRKKTQKDTPLIPPHLEPVISRLQDVAEAKHAELNVASAVKACEHHDRADHLAEVEKFALWHLEGRGKSKRPKQLARAWWNWLAQAKPAKTPRLPKRQLAPLVSTKEAA